MSFSGLTGQLFESCLDTFGELVRYRYSDGKEIPVTGIFRNEYILVDDGRYDTQISSSAPVLEISEGDLAVKPTAGDRVTVRGTPYKITEIKPNNEGQLVLILKKTNHEPA